MEHDFQIKFGEKPNRVRQVFGSINEEQLKLHKLLLDKIAKNIVPDYVWTKELGVIAKNLIYYFNGLENDYDLNKSIALVGAYGVGKTVLMRIFQKYMQNLGYGHKNIYRIVSIEDVISHMSKPDYIDCELIYNYNGEVDKPTRKPANLMINEFGFKYNGKNFGTEYQELIEMFVMKRYDIFQESGKLMHVTTNCDIDDLENIFSEKIMDRFKEMFNLIPVVGESLRK